MSAVFAVVSLSANKCLFFSRLLNSSSLIKSYADDLIMLLILLLLQLSPWY
jgi:nitrate reductase gamma subunit